VLRAEVESLLASEEAADTFLQTPVLGASFAVGNPESFVAGAARAPEQHQSPTGHGTTEARSPDRPAVIGGYKILDVLGEGGMGVVYRAQQENPRRTVALKVIKPGVNSREMLKRFEHEGQVLGWLQHPGIAQIFEAGTADTGLGPQPFFAMELIQGQPLTDYARARGLALRQRLDMMVKVCDAVHHAHQKGVIHRDLKPGNILVNEAGQPKVVDFGVARAIDADIRTTTLQTDVGQLIGTLAYMSPEQVAGDSRQLDTRSDVYALGVICYELLTGRVPHEVSKKTIPQAARQIAEEDPKSLSSIDKTFRGDVDTIVAKALEKDKDRRYSSASDLAEDLRRYLADQPIAARPPTTAYQLRKFARRNKALVAGVAIAFVTLVVALVQVTLERNRAVVAERIAEQRRAEAEEEAAKARVMNAFMERTLSAVDPTQTLGRDVSFRVFLDLAAERVESELGDQPEVQASVYNTLGRTYRNLGFLAESESHLRRALEQCRKLPGGPHSRELNIMNDLALTLQAQGKLADAEPLFRQVLGARRRTLGEEHEGTILAINNLGWLLKSRGRYEDARKLFDQALALRRKVSGVEHEETLRTMVNLSAVLRRLGRMQEAEELSTEAIMTSERVLGENHPMTLYAMSDRVWLLRYTNRIAEAEATARRTLDLSRQVLGEDHPSALHAMNNLAVILSDLRKVDEAEILQRKTFTARRRLLGEEHPDTLASMNNLAVLLYKRRKYAEAETLYAQVLEARRRVLGEEHPEVLSAMFNLALAFREQRKLEEAEPLFVEVLAAERRVLGDDHPSTVNCMTALAALYMKQDRHDKSAPLFEEAWQARIRLLGENHGGTLSSLKGLIASLIETASFERAKALAAECLERTEATFGPAHHEYEDAIWLHINLYKAWDKPEEEAKWRAMLPGPAEAEAPAP
jgi:tetratricopeptide (TPR) repeat protein